MKNQFFFAFSVLALAITVLGFTTGGHLSSLPSPETLIVRVGATTSILAKRIYCNDADSGQFSNVHHGWVCRTEPSPGRDP